MKQNKYIKNIHIRSKQLVDDEKEKQKQQKSQIELQEFDYAAKPYQDFSNIDLTGIRSIKISESGSRGVLFIDAEKGAIVLKLSGQVGVELFLNNLAQALNIKTTKMRVLKWLDEEMQLASLQILHSASYDEVLTHRIKQKLKVAYFEIIEYVPGIHLYLLSGERAKLAFTEERLLSLGKILAFDIFINNGDRFPLPVWRSVGNAYNVILKVADTPAQELFNIKNTNIVFDQFYAIDPQTILRAQGGNSVQDDILKTYQNKVRQFLSDICTELKEQRSRSLETFRDFIEEQTQYKLSNEQLLIISKGILSQLLVIINFGIQGFKDVLQTAFLPDAHDWGNYNCSLEMIHIDFHNQMIGIFKEIYDNNQELYSTL